MPFYSDLALQSQVAQAKLAYVIPSQVKFTYIANPSCDIREGVKRPTVYYGQIASKPHRNTWNHPQTSKLSFPKHFISFFCVHLTTISEISIHSWVRITYANLAWAACSSMCFSALLKLRWHRTKYITQEVCGISSYMCLFRGFIMIANKNASLSEDQYQ